MNHEEITIADKEHEAGLHKNMLKFRMEKVCYECWRERQVILKRIESKRLDRVMGTENFNNWSESNLTGNPEMPR